MPQRRSRRASTFLIQLTAEELEIFRSHVEPSDAIDHLVPAGAPSGPLVTLELNDDEADELMVALEQTANSAQNDLAVERLGYALARVDGLGQEAVQGRRQGTRRAAH